MHEKVSLFFCKIRSLIRTISPTVRHCIYNDVVVDRRLTLYDSLFHSTSVFRPSGISDQPNYEAAICRAITECVRKADHVVVVGGGYGVTSVHAARRVGESGRVTVFEASTVRFDSLQKAISINDVESIVTLTNAAVGCAIDIWGNSTSQEVIGPKCLPKCDVLELDCEGSELEILDNINIRPRAVIVETHGFRGASKESVHSRLVDMGYDVDCLGPANPEKKTFCIENDIFVLIGRYK